jgi:hypothetical protein
VNEFRFVIEKIDNGWMKGGNKFTIKINKKV